MFQSLLVKGALPLCPLFVSDPCLKERRSEQSNCNSKETTHTIRPCLRLCSFFSPFFRFYKGKKGTVRPKCDVNTASNNIFGLGYRKAYTERFCHQERERALLRHIVTHGPARQENDEGSEMQLFAIVFAHVNVSHCTMSQFLLIHYV